MVSVFPWVEPRPSPFYESAIAEGMVSATAYNRMIMPVSYGDPEGEYWRLVTGVSQWDVACERQVQLKGPDAGKLAQILTCRDLSRCSHGQAKYSPLCNHRGTIINDPILLKLADDLYWFSIADSDIWTWAEAIAAERKLKVEISEPDVSPMALQGPKAEDVVAHVLGDWVRKLKHFWAKEADIEGIPISVQRSGWSKQGGFEIYLKDSSKGTKLWNIFKEAGRPWDIGPGCPTTPECVESGLIDVGADTDAQTNPFEVRLGKYVDLDVPDDVIGIQALRQIKSNGVRRHQLGLMLDGNEPIARTLNRDRIMLGGKDIGMMTNCTWSFRMKSNIGYALISAEVPVDTVVEVVRSGRPVQGRLVDLPFR
jgi:glycine cleavage system aminomethyltransferase T